MRIPTFSIIFAVALSLTAIAGCGGSRSGGTGANTDSTASRDADAAVGALKAKFIDEANAVCLRSKKLMSAKIRLFRAGVKGKSPTELANVVVEDVITPGFEAEVRNIRALEPPSKAAKQVNAILSSIQQIVEQAQKSPLRFVHDGHPFIASEGPAIKYGLTSCGGL